MGVEVRSHKGPPKEELDFPIELVNLDDVIPHEQTIDHELRWFIESASKSETLIWPILVGNRNLTILDGHHRVAGLKELNYTQAPAILIDYYDDELIQLDTWYPKVNQMIDNVVTKFIEVGLEVAEVDPSNFSRSELNNRDITAFVGNNTRLFEVVGDREVMFKQVRDLWQDNIIYYDDADMAMDQTDEQHTAIISWAYTKKEIIQHVKAGIVHLPKTTRHTLKYKVPKCNYPLDKLERTED